MSDSIRQRLLAGVPVLGTLSLLGDAFAVEAMGHAGLDFVILDMEHTDRDMSQIGNLIRSAECGNSAAIVRLPAYDSKQVQRALDSGARGIVIPTVSSGAEARAFESSTRYPPQGVRGTCRYSRAAEAGRYEHDWADFTAEANRSILTIAFVEDREGVEELEEILDAVDVVLIGRGDLSTELGVPGQPNHPQVIEVVERYEKLARRKGRPIAAMCYTPDEIVAAAERGATFIMYSADVNVIYRDFSRAAQALASHATRATAEKESLEQ